MLNIYPVHAFTDNYIWVIHNQKYAAVVDPGDGMPVLKYLDDMGLQLVAILNTHHHKDHVGGNAALLHDCLVPVYGPGNESISTVSHPVKENDTILLEELSLSLDILEIPGHTAGHIAYYGEHKKRVLFCGDTLFACGCGRIFEGTVQQMYASLQKLANLADDTFVYCAHEYTSANVNFARMVEPGNIALSILEEKTKLLRDKNLPTLPSTIATEKATNPFLRCNSLEVITNVNAYTGKVLSDPISVFTQLRSWKDNF